MPDPHGVVCYAERRKKKSQLVLEAFAAGSGARMAWTDEPTLLPGAAVFYGVREGWRHLWEQAKREGRDWYFADNSYFDCRRERHFRVTRNAIQHTGVGASDGARFRALGLSVQPMRGGGDYTLICAQSDEFMRLIAGDPGWLARVTAGLRERGERFVVRTKGCARPLAEDLAGARLLVTWSSAAAVGALLAGVPVCCAPQCCATHAGEDREQWASVLADNEWSLEEMRDGKVDIVA